MTREEAIRWMTLLKKSPVNWVGEVDSNIKARCEEAEQEAFDMAIEALTQDLRKVTQEFDLISRQDAIDAVIAEGISVDSRYLEAERIVHESDAVEALSMLPSANRPTGKWIECESNHIEKIYLCSNCHNYEAWGETEKTPYCPTCGARMTPYKGGDDNE